MRWRVEKTEHFQKQVLGLTDTLWSSLLSFAQGYDNGSPGLRHFAVWAMVFAVFVPMVRSLWLLYLLQFAQVQRLVVLLNRHLS